MFKLLVRRDGKHEASEFYKTRKEAEAAQFDLGCDEYFDGCTFEIVEVPHE